MKKSIIIIASIIGGMIPILAIIYCFMAGIFVLDHSAERFAESLEWNNCRYVQARGKYSEEGKTIAKTSDGDWRINEVEKDDSHTFVVVRSFLDQYLFVREDYVIPTSGEITAVYWNEERITDEAFCKAVSEMLSAEWETFEYKTEALFMLTDTQHVRTIYLAYNDCPIGTEYAGYMGKINGKWVIIPTVPDHEYREEHTVICKEIPDEYIEIIESYFR